MSKTFDLAVLRSIKQAKGLLRSVVDRSRCNNRDTMTVEEAIKSLDVVIEWNEED